ncbi:hypothetical protein HYV12_00605 [Candidatus Dojkabacteria bacterium]|nr:hypothetical protein [Candidatus Dojkabacteria bacterium]
MKKKSSLVKKVTSNRLTSGIITLGLLLILSTVTYYLTKPELQTEVENTKQKSTFNLMINDKDYFKISTEKFDYEDTFKEEERGSGWVRYSDNTKLVGSSSNLFTYFATERAMTDYLAGETVTTPLEEVKDFKGYYVRKNENNGDYGSGVIYVWEPKVAVHNYLASHIYYYTNIDYDKETTSANFNIKDSNVYSKNCVLDVSQVDTEVFGYIVFSGYRSVGSETDYCENLRENSQFKIEYVKGR